FGDLLVEAVLARGPDSVLDVGCGAGATTLEAARRLGAKGHCVGVDISEPLISVARKRAESERVLANFIHADAQTHHFEQARASCGQIYPASVARRRVRSARSRAPRDAGTSSKRGDTAGGRRGATRRAFALLPRGFVEGLDRIADTPFGHSPAHAAK